MSPDPQFPDFMAVVDARERIRVLAAEGHDCPVCSQHVRIYRRALTSVSARAVVALYRERRRGYGHMPTIAARHLGATAMQGGYLTLAHHWDLIEPRPHEQGLDARGMWRVTNIGEDWVRGRLSVPSHVLLLNNKPRGYDGDLVFAHQVLGKEFDLEALLAPAQPTARLFEAAA